MLEDHEPWHRGPYTLADFIRYLNSWTADAAHTPGKQDIYSNTGFVLLSLALERRFNTPIAQLMEQRLLIPLGMTSTTFDPSSHVENWKDKMMHMTNQIAGGGTTGFQFSSSRTGLYAAARAAICAGVPAKSFCRPPNVDGPALPE